MTGEQASDLLSAIDQHWDDYRRQFKALRRDLSEESVHDLRVAARRFLAVLVILRSLDRKPRVKKTRRFLKKQLSQLDQLHDAQVMVNETAQNPQGLPGLDAFHGYLQQRSEALGGKAHRKIRASKPSDLKEGVKRLRDVPRRQSKKTDLLQRLLQAVDAAHAATMRALGALNADDPVTIHHVRIAFKQFRYELETVAPLMTGYPEGYPSRMHEYQELMGRVHDTSLLLDALAEFKSMPGEARQDSVQAVDVAALETYYRQRLAELVRAYFDRKDEIHLFWRSAPDQAFPWEKKHESVHRTPRNRRAKGGQQHSGRQPEAADRGGTQEVQEGRTRPEGNGSADRPDPHFPVPTGG
jgi:CHAD domain-containing protein